MKMDYTYKLTQDQKLVLTQEMQLSIKVLQMPISDLREYINNEFQENPVLELKDNEGLLDNQKEILKYLDNTNYKSENFSTYNKDEEVSPFNFISEKKSLKEYLIEQLNEVEENKLILIIASYIIESLDVKGYFELSIDELCCDLNVSREEAEEALEVVQGLEPYGIGARNLEECLKLQLINLGLIDDVLEKIIENHLEDIANAKYNIIAKSLGISQREAQRYGDVIRKLEPRPSSGFYTGEETKYIVPDGEIRVIDEEIHILMNDSMLPKLSINKMYKEILDNSKDNFTIEYVKVKINKALFLVKSIEQRRSTLYNVLEKIVFRQEEAFKKGLYYLKPMTLKEIAEELEIHESTVSRAIKEKYILTNYGTIKIRDLFTNKVSQNEEEIGVSLIKRKIKEIIDNENKSKPVSDQLISECLEKDGVNISRRTVAKYREELGIMSSSKRKRVN